MAARILLLSGQATQHPTTGALSMTNPRPGTFPLTIQLLTGRHLTLWVWSHTTIKALARDIATLENCDADEIRFGREVEWTVKETGLVQSRLQWLWEPVVSGGWRGEWDVRLGGLGGGSIVYVDYLEGEDEEDY